MMMMMMATAAGVIEIDAFTRAYVEAALWSTLNDSPGATSAFLDADFDIHDFSAEAIRKIVADCAKFQAEQAEALQAECTRGGGEYSNVERAGHDFWLTRCGHGAGFWDGDWPEPQASQLTKAAHAFGECDIYVGGDGKLHV